MSVLNYTISDLIRKINLDPVDTKLLLREVLGGISAAKLITLHDHFLKIDEYQRFSLLVKQRQDGMPISYILGRKEFFSRTFRITPDTLIPRPETEILVEYVLDLVRKLSSTPKLIDLGTGSGCIAITCKLECPKLEVSATDISKDALAVASENAQSLGATINFMQNDWLIGVSDLYDIIVSNPPYIANEDQHLLALKYEPLNALTDFNDGLNHIRCILKQSPNCLKVGGHLIIEHGFNQGQEVRKLFSAAGFSQVQTLKDYSDLERVTLGIKI